MCPHLLQQALGCCVQVRIGVAKAVDERTQETWREDQRHMLRPAAKCTVVTMLSTFPFEISGSSRHVDFDKLQLHLSSYLHDLHHDSDIHEAPQMT